MSIHERNVWWEIAEAQIPKLLEIIREQRAEIKTLKARLATFETPTAVDPEKAKRGLALLRFVTHHER